MNRILNPTPPRDSRTASIHTRRRREVCAPSVVVLHGPARNGRVASFVRAAFRRNIHSLFRPVAIRSGRTNVGRSPSLPPRKGPSAAQPASRARPGPGEQPRFCRRLPPAACPLKALPLAAQRFPAATRIREMLRRAFRPNDPPWRKMPGFRAPERIPGCIGCRPRMERAARRLDHVLAARINHHTE